MFGSLGLPELLVIFAIILVVFPAGKLTQPGKGLGEGISNFRDGLKGRDEKKSPAAIDEKKSYRPINPTCRRSHRNPPLRFINLTSPKSHLPTFRPRTT